MTRRFVWLSAFVLLALGGPLWLLHGTSSHTSRTPANQPLADLYPSKPALRIEVGQHAAAAQSMSVDASGRYLVTGGYDKTIRIWALPDAAHPDSVQADLELLDVLRPPIGDGDVGKIYAVAISPDGNLIAAGGWTDFEGGHQGIYIFDRARGRILIKLPTPTVAQNVAFSPDGHVLAAGLGTALGLRAWRTDDAGLNWRPLPGDSDYRDSIYGLAFDREGFLAATSQDGRIRLYDPQMNRVANVQAPGSALPFGIAFSPDGKKLVVGYEDSSAVVLLDGRTLKTDHFLQEAGKISTGGESDQSLLSVAWSADGRYVFAGGILQRKNSSGWHSVVRRWEIIDGGKSKDFDGLGNTSTIEAFAAYGPSGVLVLGSDPFIGAYDGNGKPRFAHGPLQHDMRAYVDNSDDDAFRVSRDGGVVEIPGHNQSLLRFDLAQRRVTKIERSDPSLAPPPITAGAFQITHWPSSTPVLQRAGEMEPHALKLDPHEVSESLAIGPRGKRFVLGTTFLLRLYSDTGEQLWQQPVPDVAWRVNITPDEKLVVAAFGDGTVRWYRIEDGQELLALFVRDDSSQRTWAEWAEGAPARRWIAWTPSGYYDASSGGEQLIGWHINRGPENAALFYPADRFHKTFYRPDLIAKVLSNHAVPEAPPTDTIIAHLPPIVHILDVKRDAGGAVQVTYEAESPSGKPITAIDCTIDGVPCTTSVEKSGPEAGSRTLRTQAAKDGAKLYLGLATADGPGIVRSASIPNAVPQGGPGTGKLYALVVGVSVYKDPLLMTGPYRLHYADQDAIEMEKALKAQKDKIYSDVIVHPLINEQASRDEIAQQLAWLTDTPGAGDVSMLFISGHGQNRQQGSGGKETKEYYFLPYGADVTHDRVAATGLSYSEIVKYITHGKSKKLVLVDTCHAGQVDATGMMSDLTRDGEGHRVIVWASSTGDQNSVESPEWKHGAFTYAVLDALYGRAHSPHQTNGHITQRQLSEWLDQRVDELTGGSGAQTPSPMDLSGPKFDIATVVPPP